MIAALWIGCHRDASRPRPEEPAPSPSWAHPQGQYLDGDGDGASVLRDCDDADPAVYPGAYEWCDGKDNDCDGVGDLDADGDGALVCDDCADFDAAFYPGAPDALGDGLDQDCDGTDGVGDALTDAFPGPEDLRTLGYAVAADDVDGDGCADLLVGGPGLVGSAYFPQDSVSFTSGCWPSGTREDWLGTSTSLGTMVDLRPGMALVVDWEYALRGRLLLFDTPLTRGDVARLEILGGTTYKVSSAALLGPGGAWLLVGSQHGWDDSPCKFSLFDTTRSGVIDLEYGGEADMLVTTDAHDAATGWRVADVGDRDGDGQPDLGLGHPDPDHNALYLFPEVTSGDIADAPEVWHGEVGYPGQFTAEYTGGRVDLDGDGLDEALSVNPLADGRRQAAGRVYVVPWRGPGEYWLEADAPARIEGEFTLELTGRATSGGDLDGDGQDDLVVGAPGNYLALTFPGRVSVFLGPLAGTLGRADADHVWVGAADDYAGYGLAIGDLDGSGHADLAIGAPFHDDPVVGRDAGAVYVLLDPM